MRQTFLVVLAFAVASCWATPGKRPVAQAQFCITPEHGVGELVDTFKSIARDEGMDLLGEGIPEGFGKPTTANYKGRPLNFPQGFEVAVLSEEDQDGFSAALSGPPSNQVMMGFSEIARLRPKWNVQVVSGEVGMFPLKTC